MPLNDQQIQDAIIELFKLIGASHLPSELQNINVAPDKTHFLHIQKGGADGQRINIEQLRGYFGEYNPTTDTPALSNATGTEGTYYVVTESGNKDFGNGVIALTAGDIIEFKGGRWGKPSAESAKEAVLYVVQTLTSEQKQQAQTNIGVDNFSNPLTAYQNALTSQ